VRQYDCRRIKTTSNLRQLEKLHQQEIKHQSFIRLSSISPTISPYVLEIKNESIIAWDYSEQLTDNYNVIHLYKNEEANDISDE
jgi:hypothetical protein